MLPLSSLIGKSDIHSISFRWICIEEIVILKMKNINNNTSANVLRDENGEYSKDGKNMYNPIVHDGVVYVRKGVQNLVYSIADDPQRTVIRKIVFEEGVNKICSGWDGLYDRELQKGQEISISIPSTLWKMQDHALGDMLEAVSKVYVPRISAKRLMRILPFNLRTKVSTDRYFFSNTSREDWLLNPLETIVHFLFPENNWLADTIKYCGCIALLLLYLICIFCYERTFLASHISFILIVGAFLVFIAIISRLSFYKNRRTANKFIIANLNMLLACLVFPFLLCGLFFFINDKCGGPKQQTECYIESIRRYKPRHSLEYRKEINVNMIGTDKYAEIEVSDSFSQVKGNRCTVTYHNGLFGLDVLDEIAY